jgi:hypothetical protein
MNRWRPGEPGLPACAVHPPANHIAASLDPKGAADVAFGTSMVVN